eukprot:scaffold35393_cov31-Tisochrysis_lutea.AAC.2
MGNAKWRASAHGLHVRGARRHGAESSTFCALGRGVATDHLRLVLVTHGTPRQERGRSLCLAGRLTRREAKSEESTDRGLGRLKQHMHRQDTVTEVAPGVALRPTCSNFRLERHSRPFLVLYVSGASLCWPHPEMRPNTTVQLDILCPSAGCSWAVCC